MIDYKVGNDLDLDSVLDLYRASTLGVRRPLEERERMQQMLANATLVVTAWDGPLLVGIARCLSDFSYVTYVSDLAVRDTHQQQGIGKALLRMTQQESGPAKLVLLAAPDARPYYPHIGFSPHPSAWVLAPDEPIR